MMAPVARWGLNAEGRWTAVDRVGRPIPGAPTFATLPPARESVTFALPRGSVDVPLGKLDRLSPRDVGRVAAASLLLARSARQRGDTDRADHWTRLHEAASARLRTRRSPELPCRPLRERVEAARAAIQPQPGDAAVRARAAAVREAMTR